MGGTPRRPRAHAVHAVLRRWERARATPCMSRGPLRGVCCTTTSNPPRCVCWGVSTGPVQLRTHARVVPLRTGCPRRRSLLAGSSRRPRSHMYRPCVAVVCVTCTSAELPAVVVFLCSPHCAVSSCQARCAVLSLGCHRYLVRSFVPVSCTRPCGGRPVSSRCAPSLGVLQRLSRHAFFWLGVDALGFGSSVHCSLSLRVGRVRAASASWVYGEPEPH